MRTIDARGVPPLGSREFVRPVPFKEEDLWNGATRRSTRCPSAFVAEIVESQLPLSP